MSTSSTNLPGSEPILLSNLRTALSHLYSLDTTSANSSPYLKEANLYLIDFQSRNIRRKIKSAHQRQNDTSLNMTDAQEQQPRTKSKNAADLGSSFYACIPLLINNNLSPHKPERLFCSQTILHRLRRLKISEAIDWEIEFQDAPQDLDVDSSSPFLLQPHMLSGKTSNWWASFVKLHGEKISSFHVTFLGQVLNRYYQETWSYCGDGGTDQPLPMPSCYAGISGVELEERIKGEVTLLILASAAYFSVYSYVIQAGLNKEIVDSSIASSNDGQFNVDDVRPVLQNLFSGMSLIAMRLRYNPNSVSSTLTTPIVTLLTKTLEHIDNIASSLPIDHIIPPSYLTAEPYQRREHPIYEITSGEKIRLHTMTLNRCICDALASIPDSLLGNPGGARGRLSIDPRCLQAANMELRNVETGAQLLKDAIFSSLTRSRNSSVCNGSIAGDEISLQHQILISCERWARFVPLPIDFVEETIPLVVHVLRSHLNHQHKNTLLPIEDAAFAYIIRIYDGACMTIDQIIAASVGFSSEAGNTIRQQGYKRQSSKSKKRHKERVQEAVNLTNEKLQVEEAEQELYHRGMVACRATMLSWDTIYSYMENSLELLQVTPRGNARLEGEGPIGCVCTCASACMPHLLKYYDGSSSLFGEPASAFFYKVMGAFKLVCFHNNASIRVLSFAHIITIHSALLDKTKSTVALSELENTAMHGICECALALASSCAYPSQYFSDLTLDNDEDLEIERNDVRDILRSLTSFESGQTQSIPLLPYMILDCFLKDCTDKISTCAIPPENAVHTLSSLAKPLNSLGQNMVSNIEGSFKSAVENVLFKAFVCLHSVCDKILSAFSTNVSMSNILPVGRLACLGIAALSPCFSSMVEAIALGLVSESLCFEFQKTLGLSFLTAATCVANIPELIAASSLESAMYDIRGAMRSPGGEDHVGCIALIRCASESDALAIAALKYASLEKQTTPASIIADLCFIHEKLYNAELERGPGIFHGKGVTPMSRRVLLMALSKIGLLNIKNSSEYAESITKELYQLLQNILVVIRIANEKISMTEADNTRRIYELCEASFDLSSFPSNMILSLFSTESQNQEIKSLIDTCISGYGLISSPDSAPSASIIQWGRLRGSILSLLRASGNPGLLALSIISMTALNHAECEAALLQCRAGPTSQSPLFNEKVICEELVPAGAFIIVVHDILNKMRQELEEKILSTDQADDALSSCISVLIGSKDSVFSVLSSDSPPSQDGYHIDPRPTISEAWFLSMVSLLSIYKYAQAPLALNVKELTHETLALCIHLILLKRSEKEESLSSQGTNLGMSFDGPQSLAMLEFINMALATGPDAFVSVNEKLKSLMIFDLSNLDEAISSNPIMMGGGIITAALFRGASGALPPWVIESLPTTYATLYDCCGDSETFCLMIRAGANIRLGNTPFAGICSHKKISGYYFEKISEKGLNEFLSKTRATCSKNDNGKWRYFKTILKAVCGGKKKASIFSLKPQPTDWECLRI